MLRRSVSGAMALFLGSTWEQLKERIGRSREDTTEKRIADACVATGVSMSQRMLEDEEAESRFLSHVCTVALSL